MWFPCCHVVFQFIFMLYGNMKRIQVLFLFLDAVQHALALLRCMPCQGFTFVPQRTCSFLTCLASIIVNQSQVRKGCWEAIKVSARWFSLVPHQESCSLIEPLQNVMILIRQRARGLIRELRCMSLWFYYLLAALQLPCYPYQVQVIEWLLC